MEKVFCRLKWNFFTYKLELVFLQKKEAVNHNLEACQTPLTGMNLKGKSSLDSRYSI